MTELCHQVYMAKFFRGCNPREESDLFHPPGYSDMRPDVCETSLHDLMTSAQWEQGVQDWMFSHHWMTLKVFMMLAGETKKNWRWKAVKKIQHEMNAFPHADAWWITVKSKRIKWVLFVTNYTKVIPQYTK